MKRIIPLLLAALISVSTISCSKDIQAAASLDVYAVEMGPDGGSYNLAFICNSTWTATSDFEGVVITPSSGDGGSIVNIKVPASVSMLTQAIRITFTVKGTNGSATAKSVVTLAAIPYVITDPDTIHFDAEGGSRKFQVKSNCEWHIATVPNLAGFYVSQLSGKMDDEITVEMAANTSGAQRSVTLDFVADSYPSVQHKFVIFQAGQ
jgi:hypothetical protein